MIRIEINQSSIQTRIYHIRYLVSAYFQKLRIHTEDATKYMCVIALKEASKRQHKQMATQFVQILYGLSLCQLNYISVFCKRSQETSLYVLT